MRAAKILAALLFFMVESFSAGKVAEAAAGGNRLAKVLAEQGFTQVTSRPLDGVEEFRLKKNGLTVLLAEQHLAPVVAVLMVYRIGSRNEAVGYTGSTHFLEHMMFKGTRLHDPLKGTGLDDVLKPIGGINNGTTAQDRTTYWEVVPKANLDLCIELEADRMRGLLLRDSDRQQEMTVVRNELERGEDDPDSLLMDDLFAIGFKEHPYHHPVIGWRSDVENVPTTRLKKFYDDFYWPQNATLIISGDFDKKDALERIGKRFNRIGRAPHAMPNVYTTEPPQEGERRFLVERGQDVPRLIIGYHTPAANNKDTYALEVMQSIMGSKGKPSGRLYKALIEKGIATDVWAFNHVLRDPGMFIAGATPAAGTTLEGLEKALINELEEMTRNAPSPDEVKRGAQEITRRYRLDNVDPLSRAEQLSEGVAVADWKWWINYPANISKVTPADVLRVAKKYIKPASLTVGYYKPRKEEGKATETEAAEAAPQTKTSEPEKEEQSAGKPEEVKASLPEDARATSEDPTPTPDRTTTGAVRLSLVSSDRGKGAIASRVERMKFSNGLTVLVLPIKGSGVVSISGRIKAGRYFREPERTKVPGLMADLLTAGSKQYSKLQISELLEQMGTSLDFAVDSYFLSFGTDVIKEDLDRLVSVLSDCLKNPLFREDELNKAKTILISEIEEQSADTTSNAINVFARSLFKETSPHYSKPFADQIKEIPQIKVSDIKTFHNRQVHPANTVIVFAGDIDRDRVVELVESNFNDWTGGQPSKIVVGKDQLSPPPQKKEIITRLKDKANVDVVTGKPVPISIKSKDYFAAQLGNSALGYDPFSSRLAPIRDRMGLSYSINSFIEDPAFEYSAWTIRYSVNPKNFERAKKAVSDIVGTYLREGITEDELGREKGHLAGVYVVGNRTPRAIAARLAYYEMLGLPLSFMDEYESRLRQPKKEDVNKAVRSFMGLDSAVTSAAGSLPQTTSKQE